jgi:hypothetical protein
MRAWRTQQSENSSAIAQGSTSLEPLAGELFGNTSGAAEVTSRPFWPKRMREAGMSSEAVMQVCSERAKKRAGPRHTILLFATSLSCEGREGSAGERQEEGLRRLR